MAPPKRLLPWVLGMSETFEEILENQQTIIRLLKAPGKGLSHEDRMVLERSISRLEDLAAER
jgi:hypothetical protein